MLRLETDLVIGSPGLHQAVEEEGGAAEEETDGPADTDGHLRVELRPQHLRAHGEDDSQVPEPEGTVSSIIKPRIFVIYTLP